MIQSNFESRLHILRSRIEPLEKFIKVFDASLPKPILYHSGKQHYGFRYTKPDVRHFCLLKSVRAISALNAAIELTRSGYTQEVAVLIRTLIECTTHIDFVLTDFGTDETLAARAKTYIEDYFADFARNSASDFKWSGVKQQTVHKAIGATLDSTSRQPDFDAEQLLSNVYLTFSNYVHAKYPEVMDLYGEVEHFHLRGTRGASKELEGIQYIEAFFTTVSQALVRMVQALNLRGLIESDPTLLTWYRSEVS